MALHRVTLVEQLVHSVACEILRGDFTPGSTLPSLRQLAAAHGVTLPTAQRAVAQLQTLGLVRAHHGSGVEVLNPAVHAELGALPYWIEALYDRPSEATSVLRDFLEVRRDLAAAFIARLTREADELDTNPLLQAIDELDATVEDANGDDPIALVDADIAVVRELIALRPQLAIASIFGVFERALRSLPVLQEAMYEDPEENVRGYRALYNLLVSGATVEPGVLSALLEPLDQRTIASFGDRLAQGAN